MSYLDRFTKQGWADLAAKTANEPNSIPKKRSLGSRATALLVATAATVSSLLSPADANAEAQNNEPEITDIAKMDGTLDKANSKRVIINEIQREPIPADFEGAQQNPDIAANNATTETPDLSVSPETKEILESLQPGQSVDAEVIIIGGNLNVRDAQGNEIRHINLHRGNIITITADPDVQIITVPMIQRSNGELSPAPDGYNGQVTMVDLVHIGNGQYTALAFIKIIPNITTATANPTQPVIVQLPLDDTTPSESTTVTQAPNAEPSTTTPDTESEAAPTTTTFTAPAPETTTSPDTTDLETRLAQLREERQDLNEGLRFAQEGFEQYDTIRYEQEIQEATANTQRLIDSYQAFSSSLRGLRNNMARREADNQIAILTAHLGTLEHEANQMRRDILAYSAIREYYYHLIRLYGLKIQLNQLHISVLQDTPNNELLARIDDLSSEITELEAHLEFPFGPFDTPSPFVLPNFASESETILPQRNSEISQQCTSETYRRFPANQEFVGRECDAEQEQIDAQNYLAQTSLNDFQNQEFQDKLQTIRAIAEAYPTNERQRKSLTTLYLTVLNLDEILPGEILILASHADVYPFERLLDTNSTLYRELSDWQTSPEHFIGSHQVHQENIIAALALTQRTSDIDISALVENYLVPDLEQKVARGIYDKQDLGLAISLLEKFSEATQQQIGPGELRSLNEAAITQLDPDDLIPVDDDFEAEEITQLNEADLIPVDEDSEAANTPTEEPQIEEADLLPLEKAPIEEPKQTREIKAYHELIDEELIYKTASGKKISVKAQGLSLHENDPGLIFEKENGSTFAVSGKSLTGRLFEKDGTAIDKAEPDWESLDQEWEEISSSLPNWQEINQGWETIAKKINDSVKEAA